MKDMEISIEEKKENSVRSVVDDAPQYPCGLRIHVCEKTFKKLMMSGAPVVGQEFMLLAEAEVMDVHQNKTVDDIPQISFTLQIKEMDLKSEEKEEKKEIASSLYGE